MSNFDGYCNELIVLTQLELRRQHCKFVNARYTITCWVCEGVSIYRAIVQYGSIYTDRRLCVYTVCLMTDSCIYNVLSGDSIAVVLNFFCALVLLVSCEVL